MNSISNEVHYCRICNSSSLESFMNFGSLALTGVFTESGSDVLRAPLELGMCKECGLTQLMQNYDSGLLYGESYGYESHLNISMSSHLISKARKLEQTFLRDLKNAVVVDIASNDGTLLNGYSDEVTNLIGIDPLIEFLSDRYPKRAKKIQNFFSNEIYFDAMSKPANLVTSLSVLYDLDDPVKFASSVFEILDWDGIWHFEQSYLPTMLKTLSYDTICHEHLLYLTLTDVQNILLRTGFQLFSASLNSINGGSIAVTAIKSKKKITVDPFVDLLLARENKTDYSSGEPLIKFVIEAERHKNELISLFGKYKEKKFSIVGLGASTKGNVLLQWLGLDSNDISAIGDVNPKKFNRQTPGSSIPIVPESQIFEETNEKTIALVLPWHFRDSILAKSQVFFKQNGSMLFPLPEIQIVRF